MRHPLDARNFPRLLPKRTFLSFVPRSGKVLPGGRARCCHYPPDALPPDRREHSSSLFFDASLVWPVFVLAPLADSLSILFNYHDTHFDLHFLTFNYTYTEICTPVFKCVCIGRRYHNSNFMYAILPRRIHARHLPRCEVL